MRSCAFPMLGVAHPSSRKIRATTIDRRRSSVNDQMTAELGFAPKVLVDQFHAKSPRTRRFPNGQLDAGRTREPAESNSANQRHRFVSLLASQKRAVRSGV